MELNVLVILLASLFQPGRSGRGEDMGGRKIREPMLTELSKEQQRVVRREAKDSLYQS